MYLLCFVCVYIFCKCIYLCIYCFLCVCAAGSGVGADVTLAQKIRDPAGKNTEIFADIYGSFTNLSGEYVLLFC